MNELKRLQWNRDHFEKGCICIIQRDIPKLPAEVDNVFAVEFYEKTCTCSRNYIHLTDNFQNEENLRGTGRTYRQMVESTKGTVYVWPSMNTIHYPEQVKHEINRPDIAVMSVTSFLNSQLVSHKSVVIDHSVFRLCKPEQRERLIDYLVETSRRPVRKYY